MVIQWLCNRILINSLPGGVKWIESKFWSGDVCVFVHVYVRVCVRLGLRLFCCWQVRQVFLVLMIGTAWFTQSHCGLLKTIHAFFLRIIHKLLLIWAHTIIVGRIPIMSLPSTDFPDKSDSEVNHANTMCFRNAVIKKKIRLHRALDDCPYAFTVLLLNRSHGVISSGTCCTDFLYIWFIHLLSQLNYLFSESRSCVFHPEFPVAHSRSSLNCDWMNWLWCVSWQARSWQGARTPSWEEKSSVYLRGHLLFHWCRL